MSLTRRQFLSLAVAGAAFPLVRGAPARTGRLVRTVTGPVPAGELGLTLAHEHVLVDFVGAAAIKPGRYDREVAFAKILPHLRQAAALGVRAVFECTPDFIGRDPLLLRQLSAASGVKLVTNTGLYGARDGLFLPGYAHQETAAQLAARWIREARDGIGDTGIRPGFVKSGVNTADRLSAVDRKLVEAAARTHRETGLAIAVHTGRGPGLEQLAILREHGAPASAFIWVHAASATDDALFAAADAGAWLSFDSVRANTLARHVQLCVAFKARGQLGQVLVSHDAGWYDPAKPDGGTFRPYTFLFEAFLPALRREGFTPAELDQLLITNPAAALAIAG